MACHIGSKIVAEYRWCKYTNTYIIDNGRGRLSHHHNHYSRNMLVRDMKMQRTAIHRTIQSNWSSIGSIQINLVIVNDVFSTDSWLTTFVCSIEFFVSFSNVFDILRMGKLNSKTNSPRRTLNWMIWWNLFGPCVETRYC